MKLGLFANHSHSFALKVGAKTAQIIFPERVRNSSERREGWRKRKRRGWFTQNVVFKGVKEMENTEQKEVGDTCKFCIYQSKKL